MQLKSQNLVKKNISEGRALSNFRGICTSKSSQYPILLNLPSLNSFISMTTNLLWDNYFLFVPQNMVGPGEVNEDLELETKEECRKYGEIVKCVIFEFLGGKVCQEESVRIFIEFKRLESAIKGMYYYNRILRNFLFIFHQAPYTLNMYLITHYYCSKRSWNILSFWRSLIKIMKRSALFCVCLWKNLHIILLSGIIFILHW